jgi:hypothetical protein
MNVAVANREERGSTIGRRKTGGQRPFGRIDDVRVDQKGDGQRPVEPSSRPGFVKLLAETVHQQHVTVGRSALGPARLTLAPLAGVQRPKAQDIGMAVRAVDQRLGVGIAFLWSEELIFRIVPAKDHAESQFAHQGLRLLLQRPAI